MIDDHHGQVWARPNLLHQVHGDLQRRGGDPDHCPTVELWRSAQQHAVSVNHQDVLSLVRHEWSWRRVAERLLEAARS